MVQPVSRGRTSHLVLHSLFSPHAALHVSGSFSAFGFSSDMLRKAFCVIFAWCFMPITQSPSGISTQSLLWITSPPPIDPILVKPSAKVPWSPLASPGQRVRTFCPWVVTPGQCHKKRTLLGDICPKGHTLCHKIILTLPSHILFSLLFFPFICELPLSV